MDQPTRNLNRSRLAAILGMTASEHDGEALAAARKANAMLKTANMTWSEIVDDAAARKMAAHNTTNAPWDDLMAEAFWAVRDPIVRAGRQQGKTAKQRPTAPRHSFATGPEIAAHVEGVPEIIERRETRRKTPMLVINLKTSNEHDMHTIGPLYVFEARDIAAIEAAAAKKPVRGTTRQPKEGMRHPPTLLNVQPD